MSSRDQILQSIKVNKPALTDLPALPQIPKDPEAFVKTRKFIQIFEGIGGKIYEVKNYDLLLEHLNKLIESGKKVISLVPLIGEGNSSINPADTAAQLETLDTAFVEASWGVAENGAVWFNESQLVNRLLPFICQHLVILLHTGNLLSDMHEAYQKIQIDKEGYGLFIAGPSKTADIEQSLVIGAHGARSATIYLMS
jgi:L-lactate dehydrogenase complex protein LldG